MRAELRVAASDAQKVRDAASDLGIEIVGIVEQRGAGGEAWTILTILAADPFYQGALLGYLISKGVKVEQLHNGKVVISIAGLKKLKKLLSKLK